MTWFTAIRAVPSGFKLCFFDRKIRKLAIWPWIIGFFIYLLACFAAIQAHAPLLEAAVGTPEGFWAYTLYYLAWVGIALVLVVATLIVTVVLVLVLTGVFQTAIAETILREKGYKVGDEELTVKNVTKEIGRSISTETVKLFWLLPLAAMVFLLGLIPIFTPFALVIGAWLLAYEAFDIVLDTLKLRFRRRIRLATAYGTTLTAFGLVLTTIGLIPFVGFLLPPISVAGAAWLLGEHSEILEKFGEPRLLSDTAN